MSCVVLQKGRVLEPELGQCRKRSQVVDVRPALDAVRGQVEADQLAESDLRTKTVLKFS